MNDLTLPGAGDLAALAQLQNLFGETAADLGSGIPQSYPIASFKGKVWRIKHKGEEKPVLDPTTGDPVASLFAVIVKSSPAVSKLYYKSTYTEGDDGAPDCFSLDGVKPDAAVERPPSPACAGCPMNAWGSKVTTNGQKLKACSDHKRIAIVPFPDLENQGNGPILLRVPPASLQNLAALGNKLSAMKIPYQAVVVKMSFDHELAYPKLTFTPTKALSQDQALQIKRHMESPELARMLAEPSEVERVEVAGRVPAVAPVAPAPQPQVAPQPQPRPQPQAQAQEVVEEPKPTPKQTALDAGEEVGAEQATELDAMLKGILLGD
jgi:hypothetical protein